jgi:predicted dehydrogenase
MIRVGIVGIGFMGWIHFLAYQRLPDVRVTAIATRSPRKRAGDWRGIQGNFGPLGEQVDLAGVAAYESPAELIADDRVDLVDICLPPAGHSDVAIAALGAGRHVFCEKPLALHAVEASGIVAAARRFQRRLFVGHVLPFFPEYALVLEALRSGRFGEPRGGHFQRVIADPIWIDQFFSPDIVGGPLVDLHVHDAHWIRLVFGMPTAVVTRGRRRGDVVEYCASLFDFRDPRIVVSSVMGVIPQQARPFSHGMEMHFEHATIQFAFAALASGSHAMPLVILNDGTVEVPALARGDDVTPFESELRTALAALESDAPCPALDGELALDAITLCEAQSRSAATGTKEILAAT